MVWIKAESAYGLGLNMVVDWSQIWLWIRDEYSCGLELNLVMDLG